MPPLNIPSSKKPPTSSVFSSRAQSATSSIFSSQRGKASTSISRVNGAESSTNTSISRAMHGAKEAPRTSISGGAHLARRAVSGADEVSADARYNENRDRRIAAYRAKLRKQKP